jgi:regulator of RNase E activity RraA
MQRRWIEEMALTIGFRIRTNFQRPDSELIKKFKGLPTSNIADNMRRLYCMDHRIKPLNKTCLLGPAFTVKSPQGDNLMFHRALDLAQPGDIIVVDGEGDMQHSLAGEMMVRHAMQRGLGGFLINGCMRDAGAIEDLDFPVYCKGITPQGPYKNGPGEIGYPVCCGGQVVMPGDIMVSDGDGVVVIPQGDAPDLVDVSHKKFEKEQERISGAVSSRRWVEESLSQKGVAILD